MYLWLLAILIGVLAGVLTPAAWWLVNKTGLWLFSQFQSGAEGITLTYAVFLPLSVCAAIFVLLGVTKAFRSADGFTYFISDLHFQDGRRKLRFSFVHGTASLLLLLGQGIVGIEGFCIEVLSALGSRLGALMRLSANQMRTLAACGATASIAAILGQPTTAFLFVVELLYGWGTYSFTLGTYAIAAFVAASVSQSLTSPTGFFSGLFGPDAGLSLAVRMDNFDLSLQTALVALVAGSILCGIAAAGTIWLFQKTDKELHSLLNTRRATDSSLFAFFSRLALWGALTGVCLFIFPEALGTGVVLLSDSFSQGYIFLAALLAVLLRILMGAMTYSVIGSVGMILPTLVVGGLVGSVISLGFAGVVPTNINTVALLSMGAYFSAVFGTPVAGTALVFGYAGGLMGDSAFFLFTSLCANYAAHYICGFLQDDRLATMGLYRHGIRFRDGMCFNTLSGIHVKDAMITYISPLPFQSSIGEAYKTLMDSKFSKLPVVDHEGKTRGMVSLSDFYGLDAWKRVGEESQVRNLVGVDEMLKPAVVFVSPDMNLETALQRMSDEDLVPVVGANQQYQGILLKSDLVNLYNKEVVKKAFRR